MVAANNRCAGTVAHRNDRAYVRKRREIDDQRCMPGEKKGNSEQKRQCEAEQSRQRIENQQPGAQLAFALAEILTCR